MAKRNIISILLIYGVVAMSLLLFPKLDLDVNSRAQTGIEGLRQPASPSGREDMAVVDVVKEVSPAVVSIVAVRDIPAEINYNLFDEFCKNNFFREYFSKECSITIPDEPSSLPQKTPVQVGAGTGFIISEDGIIVTNKHVVGIDEASYTVITSDGERYQAKILMEDSDHDIAILKIEANNLSPVNIGNSDNVEIGQTAIAIGNALGQFSNTVSKGIISGLGRSIMAGAGNGSRQEKLTKVIQTDAAINLGNSGGPLLNLSGEVVGINTAIVQGAQNIGFAIPINVVKNDIAKIGYKGI